MANPSPVVRFAVRLLGFVLVAAVLALAFVFSFILFTVALAGALLALGYEWWRGRSTRVRGRVIDVESRREIPPHD